MNDLKLFAKCYVEAHDLSNEDKKKFFEFIDNVSNVEIINLLETGRMEYLSETKKEQIIESLQLSEDNIMDVPYSVVKSFWIAFKHGPGKNPFKSIRDVESWIRHSDLNTISGMLSTLAVVGVTASVLIAISFYVAARYLREKLSKAGQACKSQKGKDFKKCVLKYKIDAYEGQLRLLQKGLTACNKSKEPNKCKAKINAKIANTKRKIDKLTKELQKY